MEPAEFLFQSNHVQHTYTVTQKAIMVAGSAKPSLVHHIYKVFLSNIIFVNRITDMHQQNYRSHSTYVTKPLFES